MRTRTVYCPLNGGHGRINGAAPAYPREDCHNCGQGELTNHNQYCPNCKCCLTCNRIIKRDWLKLQSQGMLGG